MYRYLFLSALFLIGACSPEVMSSSGTAYLSDPRQTDPDIIDGANYDPQLIFPARIGVVRLVYGQISALPAEERALYAQALSSSYGEFVHLGPLEAQMSGPRRGHLDAHDIRALAASRHLDYVLVLAFEPGQNSSEALFVDVRNGYPYASIAATPPGRGTTNFWGGHLRKSDRRDAATLQLAKHLMPQLEEMMALLKAQAN